MRSNESRYMWAGVGLVCLFLLATTQGWQIGHASDNPVADEKTGAADPQPYVPKTKAQLRRALTAMQFKVTQAEGTEPAFRNEYWNNKRDGMYHCVVCDLPAFDSLTKFESGTGWPSFYQPADPKAVAYKTDWHFVYRRTEVHCQRCGAHFGHVFDDGPAPTGKRYCMNSAALKFYERKADAESSTSSGSDESQK